MIAVTDYKKKKKKAMVGIVISVTILVLTLSTGLAGLFFYLDATAEARRAQQKQKWFNQWEDSTTTVQDAYRTEQIIGLTEEFASDFKETYHYYFAFDTEWYPLIVKMKGPLGEEFGPLTDYIYKDDMEEPEPVTIRGIAAPIEDDIREFAIESMNILYDDQFITDENFEDYLGISILDMSRKPVGRADFERARPFFIIGFIGTIMAVFLVMMYVRNWRDISQEEKREKGNMRYAAAWQNMPADETGYGDPDTIKESGFGGAGGTGASSGSYDSGAAASQSGYADSTAMGGHSGYGYTGSGAPDGQSGYADPVAAGGRNGYGYADPIAAGGQSGYGYAGAGAGSGQNQYGYTGSAATGYTDGSGIRLVPVKKSNVFLGILGAIGGSLIGVALWILISAVGFIAGFAGFVMLKFALKGYEKLSGRLDKKGAVISLVIAAFMVFFANVLDYVVTMYYAFFQWDASFDTIRYVIMNFSSLMTEADTWGGFYLNLVLGYALSIWSSYQLIGRILSYKEK